MNQIRLHGRIVKSKEGLNEGVLNSHHNSLNFKNLKRIVENVGIKINTSVETPYRSDCFLTKTRPLTKLTIRSNLIPFLYISNTIV